MTALTAGLTAAPGASSGDSGSSTAYRQQAGAWVRLITGDRVRADGAGRPTAMDPGPGREGIPVHTYGDGGHTYVVPSDASGLIAEGTVDRRLFDVALQGSAEYVRHRPDGLKLSVDYRGESPEARSNCTPWTARTCCTASRGSTPRRSLPAGVRRPRSGRC
ncbi:hypothetical protein GCM10010400_10990 [Streptomyces aculeolatus]